MGGVGVNHPGVWSVLSSVGLASAAIWSEWGPGWVLVPAVLLGVFGLVYDDGGDA